MRTICKIALVLLAIITVNAMADEITWVFIDDDPGVSGHEGFNGYMSKYETTNAQYCAFLNAALASGDVILDGDLVKGSAGSNGGADFVGQLYYDLAGPGYTYDGATNGGAARINHSGGVFTVDSGFENHPVTYVSWNGATAFCNYYGYRLPTEWEWQAVADYDGSYNYGCGVTIDNSKANYLGSTHPYGTTGVGSFGTYGHGMCDMAGNVWEWTSSIDSGYGVVRSGTWTHTDYYCTVLYRHNNPSDTDYHSGFRVCRDKIDMTWVAIDDPGIGGGHEGFNGEMSKYETTNAQYCQFLNAASVIVNGGLVYASDDTGYDEPYYNLAGPGFTHHGATNGGAARINESGGVFTVDSGFENHPVTYVSWYGATAFCDYYGYRLPTEWEWQAVADYDGTYNYGCGVTLNTSIANYRDSEYPDGTIAVCSFDPCGYGMCDMAGNVMEWTSSIYEGTSSIVFKGGSWSSLGSYCAVDFRYYDGLPVDSHFDVGFRVVMLRTLHVDTINGDDLNDGFSRETAFATIQKGIEIGQSGETVLVWPGVYDEVVDFAGKTITVRSAADAAVITNPGGYGVRFHTAEGAGSVLANFVIRDCNIGIQAESSSPTIDHVTVVNNIQGIVADGIAADPIITNSILWDNSSGDLINCTASYSYSADQNSHYVTQWGYSGNGNGGFNSPRDIAFDKSGNFYVADRLNHLIQKFANDGSFITQWGGYGSGDGLFDCPSGIVVDSSCYVYVADIYNHRVQKFTCEGTYVKEWGSYGSDDGEFSHPCHIALDSSENVYVTDYHNNRVQKFNNNGVFLTKWGSQGTGNGQFDQPHGIAVDSSGDVFVADQNNRIQKFITNDGVVYDYILQWGVPGDGPGEFAIPRDIDIDYLGQVYVADSQNHRIQVFNGEGTYISEWGSYGSNIGQFNTPFGIAVDSDMYIYVADSDNHRIQKFKLPLFGDSLSDDYHPKSEQGRFWPEDPTDPNEFGLFDGLWAMDPVTSPCIDDGNPMDDPSGEGEYSGGRVNMGAYGGTAYASRSDYYWPLEGDVNRDGIVNLADFAIVSENWLDSLP